MSNFVKYTGPDEFLKDNYGYVFGDYKGDWRDVNFATMPGCSRVVTVESKYLQEVYEIVMLN